MKKYKFNIIIVTRLLNTCNCYLKVGRGVILKNQYIIWFTKKHSLRPVCIKCAIVSWKYFLILMQNLWALLSCYLSCINKKFFKTSLYVFWRFYMNCVIFIQPGKCFCERLPRVGDMISFLWGEWNSGA